MTFDPGGRRLSVSGSVSLLLSLALSDASKVNDNILLTTPAALNTLPHTHTHTEAERKQRRWPSCFMAVAQSQEQSRDLLIFQKCHVFPPSFFRIVTHWYVTLLLKWNATLPGFVGNPVVSPVQLTSLVFGSESLWRETLMARGAGVRRGWQFCYGFYVHLQALDSYRWRAAYRSVQLFLCFHQFKQ